MLKLKQNLIAVITALILFIILSVSYMAPALEGKKVHQGDIVQHIGMSKEIKDYREATGEEPLWTNSVFGGMPAYLISTQYKSNILRPLHFLFLLNNWRPVGFIFLYLLGFYIALLAFGIDKWLSIVGAIAYAFSSYFIVIIVAGHNAKVFALGYMPPIIAGAYLAFRGKYLIGGLLMCVFLSLQIFITHIQISYYTLLVILVLGVFELVGSIREKTYKNLSFAVGTLALAFLLAVASNWASLATTYEYGQYSIRAKSDLKLDQENQTSGLDKDYATRWSYGIAETFTLLIPNFHGGPSVGPLPENSETFEFLKKIQSPKEARKSIKQMYTYWGKQPSTAGPVYAGAIIVFLFVLGLFIIKGNIKWWIVTISIVSVLLAWGGNFPLLTHFFLDYFPGYNKFRTVSMILIIVEFAFPLMAMLAVNAIIKGNINKKHLQKSILNSLYITGGICLFFILTAKAFFSFEAAADQQYLAQGATEIVDAWQADRLMLLRRDAFRSIIFILLAAGILWYFIKEKISVAYLIAGLGILVLIDMWTVDKRYLNKDDFVLKKEYNNPIPKSTADDFILKHAKSDPNYRVLNLGNPFNDATTSYYHKSIGGYHGAKMRRYQELIDFQIMPELNQLITGLRTGSLAAADSALQTAGALNMLNTRYIIYNPDAMPLINSFAYGHAWYVNNVQTVENANEEIEKLGRINPGETAVIDEQFSGQLAGFIPKYDSTARIELLSYAPNKLVYSTVSSSDQLAIFSEIYYPKGWEVTIDGEGAEYLRANYVLRGMVIPAGEHVVVFSFKPASYYTGNKIALASSGLIILLIIGVAAWEIRKASQDNS